VCVVYLGSPSLCVLVNKQEIVRASVKAGRRNQLALNIMDILFDSTTMCESTVNGTRDGKKRPLDASKVEAIRSKQSR
jgi:hypothetical protein